MAGILVAMAQHARGAEEQETFLRGTEAANHESNLSLASNAKTQTSKSQQSDKEEQSDDEEESESDDGTEKESKGKERPQRRTNPNASSSGSPISHPYRATAQS
jgi:hypothetical protein